MTRITWLGEDADTEAGPSFNIWNGIRFAKDVAVDMDQQPVSSELRAHIINKARGNRFYRVDEDKPKGVDRETQEAEKTEPQTQEFAFKQGENKSGYSPVKTKKQKGKKPKATASTDAAPAATGGGTDPRSSEDAA